MRAVSAGKASLAAGTAGTADNAAAAGPEAQATDDSKTSLSRCGDSVKGLLWRLWKASRSCN